MIDGETRVFSFRSVGALPLAVAVGLETGSWADAVKKNAIAGLGALAAISLALLFSGRSALRSFKKLERSDADQRELNAQLREARDDMARAAKRARMIADSLPALVAYIDASERYVFHNSFYRNVPGVDVERMAGRSMREALGDEIYPPHQRPGQSGSSRGACCVRARD